MNDLRRAEVNIDLTEKHHDYLLVCQLDEKRICIHRGPDFVITLRPEQAKHLIRHLENPRKF